MVNWIEGTNRLATSVIPFVNSSAGERMLPVFDNDSFHHILHVRLRYVRAIRGTVAPPLPYKYTGTTRAKRAPLVWPRYKTSQRSILPTPPSHIEPTSHRPLHYTNATLM